MDAGVWSGGAFCVSSTALSRCAVPLPVMPRPCPCPTGKYTLPAHQPRTEVTGWHVPTTYSLTRLVARFLAPSTLLCTWTVAISGPSLVLLLSFAFLLLFLFYSPWDQDLVFAVQACFASADGMLSAASPHAAGSAGGRPRRDGREHADTVAVARAGTSGRMSRRSGFRSLSWGRGGRWATRSYQGPCDR